MAAGTGPHRGATSEVTTFGTRWIEQLLERYNASGPEALANGRRRNGLKPSLLTAEVLEVMRLRLAEPPPDGGLWSSRKVADVIAAHLGLERVLPQRGWEVLKALGYTLQRPRPKNPKSATAQAFKKSWRRPSPRRRPPTPACPSKSSAPCESRLGLKPVLRSVWAPKGQRPTALGHHRFEWLYVTAFVGPATGETVWYLSNGVSKPLFAGLLATFAKAVGAGPEKRIVLFLDNAGFHTRPNLAVPDGLRLVYLPPYSPELQPAETFWPLVDEPIVNKLVPTLEALVDTIGARCCDLTERQSEISSRTNFSWWPKNYSPA
ncbi:MAG: IS630 family transposase [Janthinobacterium lividum]